VLLGSGCCVWYRGTGPVGSFTPCAFNGCAATITMPQSNKIVDRMAFYPNRVRFSGRNRQALWLPRQTNPARVLCLADLLGWMPTSHRPAGSDPIGLRDH
jgi:hypothetical protein